MAVTIGKNLTRLRKMANMTQLELAEQLNYSDKSVSKWEQGNGIPDVRILMQLAELYGVTIDDLVREHKSDSVMPRRTKGMQRLRVQLLCSGLCWLVAVVAFVLCELFIPQFTSAWLIFVYAVPVNCIVALVFSSIWRQKTAHIVSLSLLIWSTLACIYSTCLVALSWETNLKYNTWLVFLIGAPLQILALFFFVWRKRARIKE